MFCIIMFILFTVVSASSLETSGPEVSSGGLLSSWTASAMQVSPAGNSGTAAESISIEVPPGRKGIAPQLSLNYNSGRKNGWMGVGWVLDMGAIQRSTKQGFNYSADDYVVTVNGAASELVPRGDWGTNYYGAKFEEIGRASCRERV